MSLATSKSTPPAARILIVDDNESGLAARKSVLEELGYSITTTTDPVEALTIFGANPFSLVITDFRMPKMNGPQFIERLREMSADAPVILISGFADSLGLSGATTGADIVIQKSSNEVAHLLRAVARLMKKGPARKPPAATRAKAAQAMRHSS